MNLIFFLGHFWGLGQISSSDLMMVPVMAFA